MSEKLKNLGNKRFIQGLALGLILAAIPPVYSWSFSDKVCDMNAQELADVVRSVVPEPPSPTAIAMAVDSYMGCATKSQVEYYCD